MESPCLHCTRVRDPKNCENKTCKDWQAWFIDRWNTMRAHVRSEIGTAAMKEEGVPLGGYRYPSAHQLPQYLQTDPCSTCPCPKDACHTPCPVKAAWDETQREVN